MTPMQEGSSDAAHAPHDAADANRVQKRGHLHLAICFALLLGAALLFGVVSLVHAPFDARALAAPAWLDGKAEATLGRTLHLPYNSALRTVDAAWHYRLLDDLGPSVMEGCPGWLFYKDGLQAHPHADEAYAIRLRLLQHYVTAVHSRGVQLLVVTVPDKARIESQALCGLHQDPMLQVLLDRWQATLTQAHIAHVDLRAALDAVHPGAFNRTDVHWNQRGAQAAANSVATAALGLLGAPGTQQFTTTALGAAQPLYGDLIVLAGLEHAPNAWRPAPDTYVPEIVRPVSHGGLLDDTPPPEVMMVGSSFSRRSDFTERVGEKLRREIWNRSIDGGQFSDALQSALDDPEPWPASVHLVIWELSEQALASPLSDAERRALAKFDGAVRPVAPALTFESAPASSHFIWSPHG